MWEREQNREREREGKIHMAVACYIALTDLLSHCFVTLTEGVTFSSEDKVDQRGKYLRIKIQQHNLKR